MTIEYRAATEEQKAVIEELLAAPFPATLETIAARLNLTPLAAAQLLGRDRCGRVSHNGSALRFSFSTAATCLKSKPSFLRVSAPKVTTTSFIRTLWWVDI